VKQSQLTSRHGNVCAFGRHKESLWALSVTPRWTTRLAPAGRPPLGRTCGQDTALLLPETAPERWRNVLTRETLETSHSADGQKRLPLHAALGRFPVALLEGRP